MLIRDENKDKRSEWVQKGLHSNVALYPADVSIFFCMLAIYKVIV